MKIITMTVILGLPLMVLGQTPDQQKAEGQKEETKATAPAKESKIKPAQEQSKPQAKPETATSVREKADIPAKTQEGSAREVNKTDTAAGSSTSQTRTEQTTKVSREEFRSRHSEVFSLGRHPKDFFVQRYGERHFRLIGNTYFVFLDGCWAAVDVDGFTYTERVICDGDPEYIVVD